MAHATVTSKGQVTIPKEFIYRLQLKTGDKIEIIATAHREATIRPIHKKVDEIFGKLHKPGRKTISIETMNEAVKSRMKKR